MFDRSVYITMTQCFLIVSVLQRPTRKFAAKDFYALKKTCKVHSSQYKYMGKYYLESLCHRSLRWKYSLVRLTSGGDMMKSSLSNDCHPVGSLYIFCHIPHHVRSKATNGDTSDACCWSIHQTCRDLGVATTGTRPAASF